jgi:hypothetical protein
MIRSFFSILGVLSAALIVFCASFLGSLALSIDREGPGNEALAVKITRELSRTWQLRDIKPYYAKSIAAILNRPEAQQAMNALRGLGALRYADDVTRRSRWSDETFGQMTSPSEAAAILSEVLSKTVTVSFVGKFATGRARVTIELRSEDGAMRLWHLHIDHLDRPRPAPIRNSRPKISFA